MEKPAVIKCKCMGCGRKWAEESLPYNLRKSIYKYKYCEVCIKDYIRGKQK